MFIFKRLFFPQEMDQADMGGEWKDPGNFSMKLDLFNKTSSHV